MKKSNGVRWIRDLQSAVERLDGRDTWTDVALVLPLGDARRLLSILDLITSQTEESISPEIPVELYLLATGAMEG